MSLIGGSQCPAGWHGYNGNCFYISTDVVNQQTARAGCKALDAELASISDSAEWNFVKNIS